MSHWIPVEPTEWDLNSIRNDPVKLANVRSRLSDILVDEAICQYIALRANSEGQTYVNRPEGPAVPIARANGPGTSPTETPKAQRADRSDVPDRLERPARWASEYRLWRNYQGDGPGYLNRWAFGPRKTGCGQ